VIAWGEGPITWQQAFRDLATRVAHLESLVLATRESGMPGGQAGVLITRQRGVVSAQHIIVHHTPLLNAEDALHAINRVNVAFVRAQDAGAVLDALEFHDRMIYGNSYIEFQKPGA
jgi:hypothetical protein